MQVFEKNILGCFISSNMDDDKGEEFHPYIWGDLGIGELIKKLKSDKYGKDLSLILFQFYVNPIPYMASNIKDIESYRKSEGSIAASIIIDDTNFFLKSESERKTFIMDSMLQKLDLVKGVVTKKKLDTDIDLLKSDLRTIFDSTDIHKY